MIYTVTPNPSLDLSGIVDGLELNEKNYVYNELRIAGGNGINAGRIISRVDQAVTLTGFLGGSVGDEIKLLLKRENLRCGFVKIKGNSRINLTVSNTKDHQQTRLSFNGPNIAKSEFSQLRKKLYRIQRPSVFLFGGSLPSGISPQDIGRLIKKLSSSSHLCIVDMPGSILKDVSKAGLFLIKPNLKEFQDLTSSKVKTIEAVAREARKLTTNIPLICVSSVEGGALLVSRSHYWFGKTPKIKVRSTVGAGDSMLGGMASLIEKQVLARKNWRMKDIIESTNGAKLLKMGLACSAATLLKHGITLGERSDIFKFYSKTKVQQYQFRK